MKPYKNFLFIFLFLSVSFTQALAQSTDCTATRFMEMTIPSDPDGQVLTTVIQTKSAQASAGDIGQIPRMRDRVGKLVPDHSCQEFSDFKGESKVAFYDVLRVTPGVSIHNITSVSVTVSYQASEISGGYSYTRHYDPYNLISLNSGKTFDLQFNYSTPLPKDFPNDPNMRGNIEVTTYYVANKGSKPTAPQKIESITLSGYFLVEVCTQASSFICPDDKREISPETELISSFPNPFDSYLEVHIPGSRERAPIIQISDIQGKRYFLLNKVKFDGNHTWIASIQTATLSSGVYFCHIASNQGNFVKKIIKR